ncbi:MAG: DUF1697 domain-containing protein [Planctomycetes bacterium]|nr:DUF1697 domain-containing protein [Planctomycetota bacterium]
MPRAVAFLRAINVGGRFVKMERVRTLAEGAGLRGVSTYIQSGNLLFDCSARAAPRFEVELEALWKQELGWEVATLVRTAKQLAALHAEGETLAHGLKGKNVRHYVSLLRAEPSAEMAQTLHSWSYAKERTLVRGRELHFWCTIPSHEAKFTNARLERVLKSPATTRDWKTIAALQSLLRA